MTSFFQRVPDDPSERFETLRQFYEAWFEVSLDDAPAEGAAALADAAGRPMPMAIERWLRLTRALELHAPGPLRDGRHVHYVPELEGISLNLQAEQDLHWLVRLSDLELADPPVRTFLMDFDTDQFAPYPRLDLESVSVFAYDYLLSYTHGDQGFATEIEKIGALVSALAVDGCQGGRLGHMVLFDGPGWFARVHDRGVHGAPASANVMVRKSVGLGGLPGALRVLADEAYMRFEGPS